MSCRGDSEHPSRPRLPERVLNLSISVLRVRRGMTTARLYEANSVAEDAHATLTRRWIVEKPVEAYRGKQGFCEGWRQYL